MKLYSDKITEADIWTAARAAGVHIADLRAIKHPRVRTRGWDVFLTGSSPYASQAGQWRSATYDEHGYWMSYLFNVDPSARISWWKNARDFHSRTEGKYKAVEA